MGVLPDAGDDLAAEPDLRAADQLPGAGDAAERADDDEDRERADVADALGAVDQLDPGHQLEAEDDRDPDQK